MKKKVLDIILLFFALFSFVLLLTKPEICKSGASAGILLCGRVIIPSLFPFTVCVLFVMNSKTLNKIKSVFPKAQIFLIILISFIGGYPIGAKLLSTAVEQNTISAKKAGKMLNFCINAGPAFIISAVGSGILNSKKLGVILLLSHILSGFMLVFLSRVSFKEIAPVRKFKGINPADNFVNSVASASNTVLSICGFVILFSTVSAYINYLGQSIKFINILGLTFEITNAVTQTRNIYIIAFLLGFAGISVWCQVMSVSGKIEINFTQFLIFRILHGVLSVLLAIIILRLFPVEISVFSNFKSPSFSAFYSSASVGISLLITGIVFIISVSTKKYVGKILEDMI